MLPQNLEVNIVLLFSRIHYQQHKEFVIALSDTSECVASTIDETASITPELAAITLL